MAPVQASACCNERVHRSTTEEKYDWRFDQFNGWPVVRLGFAMHSSIFFIFCVIDVPQNDVA